MTHTFVFRRHAGPVALWLSLGNQRRFPAPQHKRPTDDSEPTVRLTRRCRFPAQHTSPHGHLDACLDQPRGGEEQLRPDFGIPWWQGIAVHKHPSCADVARPAPSQVMHTLTVLPAKLDLDLQIKAPVLSFLQVATETSFGLSASLNCRSKQCFLARTAP